MMPLKTIAINSVLCRMVITCSIGALAGCGTMTQPLVSTVSKTSDVFPAGNTQIWTQQIENQTLLPTCPTATSCSPTNQVNAVATDAEGNVLIGGSTLTELPGVTDASINTSSFVAKYSQSGQLLWVQQFGPETTSGYTNLFSIAVDSQGNTYAGGSITGAFKGYVNPNGQQELMLVKIDPNGQILFSQQYESGLLLINATGGSISILPSGDIAFGWYSIPTTVNDGNQSFIYEVDPTKGQEVLRATYLGANELARLTSDSSGNLYAIGVSLGAFPGVGGPAGTPLSPTLPFVLKIDGANGNILWQQTLSSYLSGIESSALLFALSLDNSGNVVVGGALTSAGGELCEGQCNVPTVQNQSAFLAKLNGLDGGLVWSKVITSGLGDGITGVATDQQGNIFGVGFTNGVLADGFSQPTQDFFAIKTDTNGDVDWVQQFGAGPWKYSLLPTTGIQAATDQTGNLLIGGVTQGAFPGMSNPTSLGEVFVIKFGP